MSPIEKAARALASLNGEDPEHLSAGQARWTYYLAQVNAVVAAVHEPTILMKEAGSEVVRFVGAEESDIGRQSDAANIWRFMVDALREEGHQLLTEQDDI